MNLKTKISTDWKRWIQQNTALGIDKTFIFNTLLENNFSYKSVSKVMNYEPILKHSFSEKWKEWLDENLSNSQDKDGLFKILMMHGFSYDTIKQEMSYEPDTPLDQIPNPYWSHSDLEKTQHAKACKQNQYNVRSLNVPNAFRLKNEKIELYLINNFLNQEECEYFINLIFKSAS